MRTCQCTSPGRKREAGRKPNNGFCPSPGSLTCTKTPERWSPASFKLQLSTAQHSSALRTCGQKVTHLAIQPNVGGQALKCFRSTVFVLGETAAGQRLCKEHPSQDRPFRTRLTSLCGGIYTSIGLKTNLYLGHLVWISANLLLKSGWASQRTRAPCQPYGSTSNLLDSTQKHQLPTCREREREQCQMY